MARATASATRGVAPLLKIGPIAEINMPAVCYSGCCMHSCRLGSSNPGIPTTDDCCSSTSTSHNYIKLDTRRTSRN